MNDHQSERIEWPLSERGEWILAAALIAGIVQLVYFTAPQIANSVDYTAIYEPHFHFIFESLSAGSIPWWNPYVGLGRPLMSDIHYGLYYPPTYLFALGEQAGLFLTLWLHYLLLWWGTRGLARELGASRMLAFVAGVVIILSGNYSGRMLSGMLYFVFQECYAPLILWLTIRLSRNWDWPLVTKLTTAVFFMFLCGNGHVFWIIMLGAAVFLVGRLGFEYRELSAHDIGMVLGQFTVAVGLFVGLSAFAWLPYLDLIANSNRAEPAYEFATFMSATPGVLLSLVARPPGDFRLDWEYMSFVGGFWALAAGAGMAGSGDRRMKALSMLFVFAIVFALGAHTPIFKLFYHLLPGTKMFRVPSRILVLATIALIVAAAVFLSRRPRGHERWIAGGTLALGIWFAGVMMRAPGLFRPDLSSAASLALAAAVLLWWPRMDAGGKWPVALTLITALSLAELVPVNLWMKRAYIPVQNISPTANPNVAAVAQMKASLERPPHAPPPRVNIDPEMFPRNAGMLIGVADITGDTPLFLGRPWRFLHAVSQMPMDGLLNNSLPFEVGRLPPQRLSYVSLDIGLDPAKNEMIAVPAPFPRAYFTTRIAEAPDEAAAIRTLLAIPPGPIAVIESNPPGPAPQDEFFVTPITKFGNNRIELSFTNQFPGYLVLNEAWFPGWRAQRGDVEIPATPVNAWMRGFRVPPGDEPLVIEFRPRHLALGGVISVIALAVLLCLRRRVSNANVPTTTEANQDEQSESNEPS